MPAISVSIPPHPLGVVITVSATQTVAGTRTAYSATKALLDAFVASNLCNYEEKAVTGSAWPGGGTKFTIHTPGTRTARGIKDAILILDNEKLN